MFIVTHIFCNHSSFFIVVSLSFHNKQFCKLHWYWECEHRTALLQEFLTILTSSNSCWDICSLQPFWQLYVSSILWTRLEPSQSWMPIIRHASKYAHWVLKQVLLFNIALNQMGFQVTDSDTADPDIGEDLTVYHKSLLHFAPTTMIVSAMSGLSRQSSGWVDARSSSNRRKGCSQIHHRAWLFHSSLM